jgi:hypothetical protein
MSSATAKADYQKGLDAYNAGDYATAMKEWRPLAEQGNADAQYNLGFMYSNGNGVPQDDVEAMKWYRLAADQGYARAQAGLGFMYYNGDGVPEDYVEAYKWWNLAAAQGYADAKSNKEIVEKKMTRQQIAEGQRLSREWFNEHQ